MAYRPKDTQERILHRIKIAQGHLKKVASMVDNDAYCIDVLHQSHAVQSALKEVDKLILNNHLKSCVVKNIKTGQADKTIEEIMKVFERKDK